MTNLIPDITTDYGYNCPVNTAQQIRKNEMHQHSTVLISYEGYIPSLNSKQLRLLEEFKTLNNNWDEEGALAPKIETIRSAVNLVLILQNTGEKVYHVAPGPKGEIMVDLRASEKSVEILFYPEKAKYIFFPKFGQPLQGQFTLDQLQQILKWLHE